MALTRTTRWTTTLDGRPLTLRAVHDPEQRELVISMDGIPVRRATLPEVVWGPFTLPFESDGHAWAFTLVPGEDRVWCEASIDGRPLRADGGETSLHHEEDGRAWLIAGLLFDAERYGRLHPEHTRAWRSALIFGGGLSALAVVMGLAGALIQPVFEATLLVGLTAAFWGYGWRWSLKRRMQDRLATGAVVPAIVVSVSPCRIAVQLPEDPGQPGAPPSLLVLDQPLHHIGPVRVGDQHAVVVDHDADPPEVIAVELACADKAATDALRASIPDAAWRRLDVDWAIAGRPSRPGRYTLRPGPTLSSGSSGSPARAR